MFKTLDMCWFLRIQKNAHTLFFMRKKFLEAAQAFTDALDMINTYVSLTSGVEPPSLSRQVVTLLNNRSAMYEKANVLELGLEDCVNILEREATHSKARARKLRILEGLKRYNEALIEVCAIQLLFMQANRPNLMMGLPVPPPPISQSKMAEILQEIVPREMELFVTALEQKRKGSKHQNLGRPLPGSYTILQLLRSYTSYNAWMAQAAQDGSIDKLSGELGALTQDSTLDDIARRAIILLKRGRRHVYERSYENASQDFENAYQSILNNKDAQDAMQSSTIEENAYARLLEWTGMVRHWHYALDDALECYRACAALEPTNALVLVKQAGVQLDNGKHDEALELFDAALRIDPNTVDALLHRSNLRMLQAKPEEAKKDLEKCLEIRPNYVMARLRLAAILAASDATAANRQLDFCEQADPDNSEVQSYRGEVYFTQGEMEQAHEHFEKAMKLEKTNPTPYVNAAMALLHTPMKENGQVPDTGKIIKLLEQAIEVDPQFTAAYIHLGQLKLGTATSLTSAREVVPLYDQGLENCRSPEEVKELCSNRVLALAQIEAASQLKMETFNSL